MVTSRKRTFGGQSTLALRTLGHEAVLRSRHLVLVVADDAGVLAQTRAALEEGSNQRIVVLLCYSTRGLDDVGT